MAEYCAPRNNGNPQENGETECGASGEKQEKRESVGLLCKMHMEFIALVWKNKQERQKFNKKSTEMC